MFKALGAVRALLAVAFVAVPATPVHAQFWQCVTYARAITAVEIRGNAKTWWGQAAGRYARGDAPAEGAVMAFSATRAMPQGHVAVVKTVVSAREVLLDHANWSRRGQVERGVRAVDVSSNNDWSEVRVQFAGVGLGTRTNPLAGFIYPTAQVAAAAQPLRPAGSTLLAYAR